MSNLLRVIGYKYFGNHVHVLALKDAEENLLLCFCHNDTSYMSAPARIDTCSLQWEAWTREAENVVPGLTATVTKADPKGEFLMACRDRVYEPLAA